MNIKNYQEDNKIKNYQSPKILKIIKMIINIGNNLGNFKKDQV
jgi:hypothetical protein